MRTCIFRQYPGRDMAQRLFALLAAGFVSLAAEAPPKFEDFAVDANWQGPNAAVRLDSASSRMFRTKLIDAAKQPPDFAGHYRFASWGCGSVCAAGALIDLQTGIVYPPPGVKAGSGWDRWIFAGGFVDGPFLEHRPNSRLAIVRKQARDFAFEEASYYEWTGSEFRLLTKRLNRKPIKAR
jgi:hypothetical protein